MSMRSLMAAQVEEMLRDKWIQSEKAGYDLGDACMLKWIREHAADFRRAYNLRHMDCLDDGTRVESISIYPDDDSRKDLCDTIAIPSGWNTTDCRFNLPESAKPYVADILGGVTRIMVAIIGYGTDGIYVAGVVEGIPAACVARIAEPPTQVDDGDTHVDWLNAPMAVPVTGVLDTYPRQFE